MQCKRSRDSLMVHVAQQHKRRGALAGKETWEGVFFEQAKTGCDFPYIGAPVRVSARCAKPVRPSRRA